MQNWRLPTEAALGGEGRRCGGVRVEGSRRLTEDHPPTSVSLPCCPPPAWLPQETVTSISKLLGRWGPGRQESLSSCQELHRPSALRLWAICRPTLRFRSPRGPQLPPVSPPHTGSGYLPGWTLGLQGDPSSAGPSSLFTGRSGRLKSHPQPRGGSHRGGHRPTRLAGLPQASWLGDVWPAGPARK